MHGAVEMDGCCQRDVLGALAWVPCDWSAQRTLLAPTDWREIGSSGCVSVASQLMFEGFDSPINAFSGGDGCDFYWQITFFVLLFVMILMVSNSLSP